MTKSGSETAGVKRQFNGNRGKIENCVSRGVLSYSAPGFNVLIDAQLLQPEEWANDPVRQKERHPDDIEFRTNQGLGQSGEYRQKDYVFRRFQ